MIEITTTKATILIVDLPEGAYVANTMRINYEHNGTPHLFIDYGSSFDDVVLPPGQWELLGKTFDLTEEQWERVVDEEVSIMSWDKYSDMPEIKELTSTESGLSLLATNKVYMDNPLGNQPEFVFNQYGKSPIEFARFEKDMFEWQQAQSRTMPNSVILIKKS